jgi:hypothetical protein
MNVKSAAMRENDLSRDREPEAGAPALGGPIGFNAIEAIEQMRQMFRGNARPDIGD